MRQCINERDGVRQPPFRHPFRQMRAQVLDSAAAIGMSCIIQAVTADMVESAHELFLTNSLIGIWPIRRIEARHYVVGQISQTLQAALHAADCLA